MVGYSILSLNSLLNANAAKYKLIKTQLNQIAIYIKLLRANGFGERDRRVTTLLDLDLAAEDLNCNLSFYSIPTNLEKFGELYETPLSE